MQKTQSAPKMSQDQERKILACLVLAATCFALNLIITMGADMYLMNEASQKGLFVAGVPFEKFSLFSTPLPFVSTGAIILIAFGTLVRLYTKK